MPGGDLIPKKLTDKPVLKPKKPVLADAPNIPSPSMKQTPTPPINQPNQIGLPQDGSDEEGGEEEGGGEDSGSSQSNAKGQKKSEADKSENQPAGDATKTGEKAAQTGEKAAQGAATHAAEGAAEKAAAGATTKAVGSALGSAGGPLGTIAGWLASEALTKVATWAKNNWKYILMGIGALILIIGLIIGFGLIQKSLIASAVKIPVNAENTKAKVVDLKASGGADKVSKFTNESISRYDETYQTIKTMIEKENPEVRGASQRSKILSLLNDYQNKIAKLKDLVGQIQAKQLNIKKEEELTQEEFVERNKLQSEIDQTYLESDDILKQLEKELNYCDKLDGAAPNANGFYYLDDNVDWQKFASSDANGQLDPWWGRAMTICYVKTLAQKWKSSTGDTLWVGEISRASGDKINDFGLGWGHLDGMSVALSSPGTVPNSLITFKSLLNKDIPYNQAKAEQFAQLLWQLGAGQVYLADANLNKKTTTDILGRTVTLSKYSLGNENAWNISLTFPNNPL